MDIETLLRKGFVLPTNDVILSIVQAGEYVILTTTRTIYRFRNYSYGMTGDKDDFVCEPIAHIHHLMRL